MNPKLFGDVHAPRYRWKLWNRGAHHVSTKRHSPEINLAVLGTKTSGVPEPPVHVLLSHADSLACAGRWRRSRPNRFQLKIMVLVHSVNEANLEDSCILWYGFLSELHHLRRSRLNSHHPHHVLLQDDVLHRHQVHEDLLAVELMWEGSIHPLPCFLLHHLRPKSGQRRWVGLFRWTHISPFLVFSCPIWQTWLVLRDIL